jgi:hypothetical protein
MLDGVARSLVDMARAPNQRNSAMQDHAVHGSIVTAMQRQINLIYISPALVHLSAVAILINGRVSQDMLNRPNKPFSLRSHPNHTGYPSKYRPYPHTSCPGN